MAETWKPIAGYEGLYEVSDLGRVRSLKFGKTKILKPGKTRGGYLRVGLCKDGQAKNVQVHRLVAEAFIPNPLNLETVNHKDEVKTNNSVANLEWMTRADNTAYSRPWLAGARRVKMIDKKGNLLRTFPSTAEAQRAMGIAHSNISKCCLGKLKSTGGYKWQYA